MRAFGSKPDVLERRTGADQSGAGRNSILHRASMVQSSAIVQTLNQRSPYVVAPVSAGIAYLALSSTPSFPLVVALLTTLLVQADDIRVRRASHGNAAVIAGTTAIGGALARLGATTAALSTPSASIAISLAYMGTMSSLAVTAALYSTNLAARAHPLPGWTRLCIFPVIWTALSTFQSLTPLGRLLTWTPVEGYGMYSWLLPFFGAPVLDWLGAAWAVVLTQAIVEDVDTYQDDTDASTPTVDDRADRPRSRVPLLAMLLLVLAIPSHFQTAFHAANESSDKLGVACVLPADNTQKDTVDRYIEETKKYLSLASVVLWPEAAVTVSSEAAKQDLFDKVKLALNNSRKAWVAVSYVEPAPQTPGKHLNAVSLVNAKGEILFTSYKRNLVPLVESYSQVTEDGPPPVADFPLSVPISNKKHTIHPVPMTASICLDFASPLPLARKPALVLAPAHTWHADAGAAMAAQARARAQELDAYVLWCDGGAGGRSALIGPHGQDVLARVGAGSWALDIPVEYPFPQRRTLYGAWGNLFTALVLCVVVPFALAPFTGARLAWTSVGRAWSGARERAAWLRERVHQKRLANERTPLLIDFSSDNDPRKDPRPIVSEVN